MKMTPEHYEQLANILDLWRGGTAESWRQFNYNLHHKLLPLAKDLDMYYRWAIFNKANDAIRKATDRGILDIMDLYSYLDDDHIDTALRKYVKERNL